MNHSRGANSARRGNVRGLCRSLFRVKVLAWWEFTTFLRPELPHPDTFSSTGTSSSYHFHIKAWIASVGGMEGGIGSDGQIIGESSFQSHFLFWSPETYSRDKIKGCGPFHVFKPRWMKKLRFPTAACFLSSEEHKRPYLPFGTVAAIMAVYLLSQLLEVRLGPVHQYINPASIAS